MSRMLRVSSNDENNDCPRKNRRPNFAPRMLIAKKQSIKEVPSYLINPNDDDNDSNDNNKVVIINNPPTAIALWKSVFLCLYGVDVDGISLPSCNPSCMYCVVFSLSPRTELWSPPVQWHPNPSWRGPWQIMVEGYEELSVMKVEVLRFNNGSFVDDPGTSSGTQVVGRARVPLPMKLRMKTSCRFELAKLEGRECKPEGSIGLTMALLPVRDHHVRPPVIRKGTITALD